MNFTFPNSIGVVRACVVASLLTGFALSTGCGDDEGTIEQVCGGHGERHGDHCHCDAGYVLSEDEQSCVAPDGEDGHGHEHEQDAGGGDSGHEHSEDAGHEGEFEFASSELSASTGMADDGTQFWVLEAIGGDVVLGMELYEAFGGPTSAGVVEIGEAETDYASCGTCLILKTGCEAHGDHFHCERSFMPRAEGQVHLDAIGGAAGEHLTGELLGVVFQEVNIGEGYETEPVQGGEVLQIEAWSFDVELAGLPLVEEECNGHGHLHGDTCHCDAGYVLDLTDSTQCIPE